MSQNIVTLKIDAQKKGELSSIMDSLGWSPRIVKNNPYIDLSFISKEGAVATLYSSGKLVLQGNKDFSQIIGYINKGCNENEDTRSRIGVDEVGKGDYFGPLVVVACFVDREFVDKISCLGFGDSKNFSDKKIRDMFSRVKDYPYYYSSILMPADYNDLLNEYGNVSILLAKQHSKCIEMGLKDLERKGVECSRVVVDQFSSSKSRVIDQLGELGKKVELEQFHGGESDIAVASASIIARGIFLGEFDKMNEKYSMEFPKGASNVIDSGVEFVKRYGSNRLREVAKVSFKTTKKILSLL